MGRWQPGARGRMMRGALELFVEQGFEQTTALQIAERAGVTERTFYRYFIDKREVLFDSSRELQQGIVAAIEASPLSMPPLEVVTSAMESATAILEENRPYSRQRAGVISANASLQERELLKMHSIAAAVAEVLRARGVPDLAARIAAESGSTFFAIGFESWIADGETRTLAECIREARSQLELLTGR